MLPLTESEHADISDEIREAWEDTLEETFLGFAHPSYIDDALTQLVDYFLEEGVCQQWCEEEDDLTPWVQTILEETMTVYNLPPRQGRINALPNPFHVSQTLEHINAQPFQKQRSTEWHELRYSMFSASNIWKLFDSPSNYNSLICEKAKPFNTVSFGNTSNGLDPRSWGVKYESLSISIYEKTYQTEVATNYGCIKHPTLPIGASPDGINISSGTKYGHLLEVKNIYNREINGIPSHKYWIQIQNQLETMNLFYCDFLETRFKEVSKEIYDQDTHQWKGIILYFVSKTGIDTQFEYVPFEVDSEEWIARKVQELEEYVLYETSYWYLDEFSCVTIERNAFWFEKSIPVIQAAWEIVEKERADGSFVARLPRPRNKDKLCVIKLDGL